MMMKEMKSPNTTILVKNLKLDSGGNRLYSLNSVIDL